MLAFSHALMVTSVRLAVNGDAPASLSGHGAKRRKWADAVIDPLAEQMSAYGHRIVCNMLDMNL